MKKLLYFTFLLMLALAVVGCGENPPPADPSVAPSIKESYTPFTKAPQGAFQDGYDRIKETALSPG